MLNDNLNDNLNDVKLGDLIYTMGGWGNQVYLRKVERVTKTQVIIKNDIRIRKSDGYVVGQSGYRTTKYEIATPEIIRKAKSQHASQKIAEYFNKPLKVELELEKLEQILEIIGLKNTDE